MIIHFFQHNSHTLIIPRTKSKSEEFYLSISNLSHTNAVRYKLTVFIWKQNSFFERKFSIQKTKFLLNKKAFRWRWASPLWMFISLLVHINFVPFIWICISTEHYCMQSSIPTTVYSTYLVLYWNELYIICGSAFCKV